MVGLCLTALISWGKTVNCTVRFNYLKCKCKDRTFYISTFHTIHGRSVTEMWGRGEMKNVDIWGEDETKNLDLLGDDNSNMVIHAQKDQIIVIYW